MSKVNSELLIKAEQAEARARFWQTAYDTQRRRVEDMGDAIAALRAENDRLRGEDLKRSIRRAREATVYCPPDDYFDRYNRPAR